MRNDLILQQVVPLPWRGMVMLPRPAAYHWKVVEITDTYDIIGFFSIAVYDKNMKYVAGSDRTHISRRT